MPTGLRSVIRQSLVGEVVDARKVRIVGSMRFLHRVPLRPDGVWLTAVALMLPAAIWVITPSSGPGAANDLTPLLARWQASGCTATCYSPAVEAVGANVAAILSAAKNLRGHQPTRILVTDYWNVSADGDVARASDGPAYLRWSDELTRALNSAICTVARDSGVTCVDLYAPFKGDGSLNPTTLLAADGDHPNAAGNRVISAALMAATPRGGAQDPQGTG